MRKGALLAAAAAAATLSFGCADAGSDGHAAALQPNSVKGGAAMGHEAAAAAHTKEIYGELDFDRLCAADGAYRKRVSRDDGESEVCLREWAVLVMGDAAKADLVEEVSQTPKSGVEVSSRGTYTAVVCKDMDWAGGADDSADCPRDVASHYIEAGTVQQAHARWSVESARPLRVHWVNTGLIGAAKPSASWLGRQVAAAHEHAKTQAATAESAVRILVAEQQLFLGQMLKQMYEKVPAADRPKDAAGEPFPELPVRVSMLIRADFVAATRSLVDSVSGGKFGRMDTLLAKLAAIDSTTELTSDDAKAARKLAAEAKSLSSKVVEAVDATNRAKVAERLNVVAAQSLYRHLGLDKGAGPADDAVPDAALAAAGDQKNVDDAVDKEMARPINQLDTPLDTEEADPDAVSARLATLAESDPKLDE